MYRSSPQRQLDGLHVQRRHPALSNETLLRHVQIEQVQRVVNGLDLAHLYEPVLDVLRSSNQHAVTVVLSLA